MPFGAVPCGSATRPLHTAARSVRFTLQQSPSAHSCLSWFLLRSARRPYFLPVHVREFSTADKVANITAKLGSEFEVIPVDQFFQYANAEPTFRNRNS